MNRQPERFSFRPFKRSYALPAGIGKRLIAVALLLIVLVVTRGPALVAAGTGQLGGLGVLPVLRSSTGGPGLPRCGAGAEVGAVRRWLSVVDGSGGPWAGEVALRRGWGAWLAGKCAEAEAAWAKACGVEASPQAARACLRLFLSSEGKLGGLAHSVEGAEAMAAYAYRFGRWAEDDEWESEAVFAYELSLQLHPSLDAGEKLARRYQQASRTDDALVIWEGLVAALPAEDEDHWWALGRGAELGERWEEAAEAYGRGAAVAVQPYSLWMAQGDTWRKIEEWGKAEESYQRAVAERPDARAPYEHLGHVRRAQKDYTNARRFYLEAASIDPESVGPWFYVGLASFQAGDVAQASAAFETALTINPDHSRSTYYLAECLHREGELDQAVWLLARAVSLHSGEPWRWAVRLGDWRLELGDTEGALEAYRQALTWRPGEDSIEQRIEEVTDQCK